MWRGGVGCGRRSVKKIVLSFWADCGRSALVKVKSYFFIARCNVRCLNGGKCIPPGKCRCLPGYGGPTCEQGKPVQMFDFLSFVSKVLIYRFFSCMSVKLSKRGKLCETRDMSVSARVLWDTMSRR